MVTSGSKVGGSLPISRRAPVLCKPAESREGWAHICRASALWGYSFDDCGVSVLKGACEQVPPRGRSVTLVRFALDSRIRRLRSSCVCWLNGFRSSLLFVSRGAVRFFFPRQLCRFRHSDGAFVRGSLLDSLYSLYQTFFRKGRRKSHYLSLVLFSPHLPILGAPGRSWSAASGFRLCVHRVLASTIQTGSKG